MIFPAFEPSRISERPPVYVFTLSSAYPGASPALPLRAEEMAQSVRLSTETSVVIIEGLPR